MKRFFLDILILIFPLLIFSQQKPELKNDYLKYMQDMDAYFENEENKKSKDFKHYMRWRKIYAAKIGNDKSVKNFFALDVEAKKEADRLVLQSSSDRVTHGSWEDLGPHDYYVSDSYSGSALGRISCIAFHPTDPNILFAAGPAGGLWKTVNHGGSWECISNNFIALGISDIVVNPSNPDIIYILTGDGDSPGNQGTYSMGVLKTTNGGLTWQPTGKSFNIESNQAGYCLRKHPFNHDILFMGIKDQGGTTDTTLWVTYDAGNTWYGRLTEVSVYDIEFKPGSSLVSYAATSNGIFKSTNNGFSYFSSSTGLPPNNTYVRLAISVSPSDADNLYVLCGGVPASSMFTGVYKSTDSGSSYTLMGNSPNILATTADGGGTDNQAGYDLCIAVDPANDARVFVGAINGWKSENSGVNWSRETYWTRIFGAVDPFVHADWHNIYYKGSRIYSANDGGIFYSDDQGNSWSEISSGLGVTQFYNIDVHNGEWIGGTQDNGTNEATIGNTQMHGIWGGDGMGCTWHNQDQSIKIISSQGDIVRRQFGSNLLINQSDDNFWDNELAMATNSDHVFAIQFRSTLIRGHQNTFPYDWTWYNTGNSSLNLGGVTGFAQGISDPSIMYLSSQYRLLKSTSIFTTPTAPWDTLPAPLFGLYYEKIVVDSFDVNKVWVICGGYYAGYKVFRSINGGMTWTNISGSLPNTPMRRLVAKSSGLDELYVGTDIGVFYWNENINDWIYFSNGLPTTFVYDLELNDGYLYAGTYGRGIWRTQLYTPCPNSINLSVSDPYSPYTPGKQEYSASNIITSNRIYNGSLGTDIIYRAENRVDLTEGFWAKQGTTFTGTNDGCP